MKLKVQKSIEKFSIPLKKTIDKKEKKLTISNQNKRKIQSQLTLDFFGIKIPKINNENLFENLTKEKLPNLKIICWNINGLRSIINKGDLQYLIEKEKPEILCLNETKIDLITLKKEKYELLFKKDYLTYWNFSNDKKGYSGVSIFTKYKPIKIIYEMGIKKHDKEGRIILIEYNIFILICVYFPNSGKERLNYRIKEWDIDFYNFIKDIKNKFNNKSIIICGDLNVIPEKIDIYDIENYNEIISFRKGERENFFLLLNNMNFVDSFRFLNKGKIGYSWFGNLWDKKNYKGCRCDFFLVDKNIINDIKKSDILDKYNGSDHVPICLIFK